MGGRILLLIVAVLTPSVLAVLALRHLGRTREWERLEREMAAEMGHPIPEPAPFPARPALVCIATGAVMPFSIVYLAWLARLVVSPFWETTWIALAAMILGMPGPFFSCFAFVGAVFGQRRRAKTTGRSA
jgi:hypothetical protein